MFKLVKDNVWAFDVEWVPDPKAGRLLYDLDESVPDRQVLERMWKEGGATAEDPYPFLKMILCRIVSISAVVRKKTDRGIVLDLVSLPKDLNNPEDLKEKEILRKFLEGVGKVKPQVVGFNSHSADLLILTQRSIVNGLHLPGFATRPEKPWLGADYFAPSDYNIDLRDVVSSWGAGKSSSLNELAVLSGIPGKMDVDGNQVAQMWLDGKIKEIVDYNEFDALTTYLVWLRMAHFGGFFSSKEYLAEEQKVRELIEKLSENPDRTHLKKYLLEWDRLKKIHNAG